MALRVFGAEQKADEPPTGSGPLMLVELVMQIKQEQMYWIAEQQGRQEEWKVVQQEAQQELWEGIRHHQEGGRMATRRPTEHPEFQRQC